MGAWGHKTFENDGACDFLDTLQGAGPDALAIALQRVVNLPPDAYLDVDDATAAIAAAELVAAAHGGGDDRLPKRARAWLFASRIEARRVTTQLAHQAVTRVYTTSELRDLWDDGTADSIWHHDIRALLARLPPESEPPGGRAG